MHLEHEKEINDLINSCNKKIKKEETVKNFPDLLNKLFGNGDDQASSCDDNENAQIVNPADLSNLFDGNIEKYDKIRKENDHKIESLYEDEVSFEIVKSTTIFDKETSDKDIKKYFLDCICENDGSATIVWIEKVIENEEVGNFKAIACIARIPFFVNILDTSLDEDGNINDFDDSSFLSKQIGWSTDEVDNDVKRFLYKKYFKKLEGGN